MESRLGRIYKLYSPSNPDAGIYIGSTFRTLDYRLRGHNQEYSYYTSGKRRTKCESSTIIAYEDAIIELIEEVECSTDKELRDREGRHIISNPECVNKRVPGRTKKEYRTILIECEICKKTYPKGRRTEHIKTKYCQDVKNGLREVGEVRTSGDYIQKWRETHREKYNEYMREYRKRKSNLIKDSCIE